MKRILIITTPLVLILAVAGVWLFRAYRVADIISDEAYQDELSLSADKEYQGILDFLREGFKNHWASSSPEDKDLSPVWNYCSESASYAEYDIDGDGVCELLLADDFGDGNYIIYDIFTFDGETRSPVHLVKGGERDTFTVNCDGVIIENGSNSAFDSFQRGFIIEGGRLTKIKGDKWQDDLQPFDFTKLQEN